MKKTFRISAVAMAVSALSPMIGLGQSARAAEDDAKSLLKAMSVYLAAQKTISASFDSSVEVITPTLEKIQFASSGTMLLSRPDKLYARRTGGYSDVELFYNGKKLDVHGKNIDSFVEVDTQGSVDQLADLMRSNGIAIPGADLLVTDPYKLLMADVIEAKHIGQGVVGGVECEHLAFRNQDSDWQIWLEVGANPIPRKFVITSKTMASAPQYTLEIRDWKTGAPEDAAAFEFVPSADAKKVGMETLAGMDEIPPSTETEGQKP